MNNLTKIKQLFDILIGKEKVKSRNIDDAELELDKQYRAVWEQLDPIELAQLKLQDPRYLAQYKRSCEIIDFMDVVVGDRVF